jgi:glyoxylase-like metal-dependent hydrolase (beta-lactamase superfamily II)
MHIQPFFDPATFTVTYVVADPVAKACVVIDPVLDFDEASGRVSHGAADKVIAYIRGEGFALAWILETHAHADHLSAAAYIRTALGGKIAIGAHITAVQAIFGKLFNLGPAFVPDGSQFDRLFNDGDTFGIGGLTGRVMHTPGHTPACVTYLIGDAAFIGDTLFMPDYGSARADFPGGDARTLYGSIQKILALPETTRLFTGHDYKAEGRDSFAWESTVAAQRGNVHLRACCTEDAFIAMRTARDKTLSMPHLLLPAIQVNIRAGALPAPEDNGVAYLKVPLNAL